ncbi:phage head morphogenesis protein [Klebsiella oxytoca]|uniref:phage head morphogenesis protein n=1 Tax=Klebsiella oxytoca TaxID=571 RepID=UPI00259774FC|nr:phage minor head protein [Klebsiella oxytoca]MDM4091604.1 head morphogenesis protein [Klebsiella oxytoca]
MPRRQRPISRANLLRGAAVFVPISAGQEYQHRITREFDLMRADVLQQITTLFKNTDSPVMDATLDASIVNAAAGLLRRLRRTWQGLFDEMTDGATKWMIERVTGSAGTAVKRSLEEIGEGVSLNLNMQSAAVKEVIRAGSYEAANLIKRVPGRYLDDIGDEVMRSISAGQGLADLQPALDSYGVKVRNWTRNVALDQTRKVYNSVTREGFKSAGIRRWEWVHSGGSNDPREYHLMDAPAGLNGGIFSFDDPPIIDKRTGERGFPGQLPYCRCTLRPVVDFED